VSIARGGVDFFDLWIAEGQAPGIELNSSPRLADILRDIAELLDYCLCAWRLVVGKQFSIFDIYHEIQVGCESSRQGCPKSRISASVLTFCHSHLTVLFISAHLTRSFTFPGYLSS